MQLCLWQQTMLLLLGLQRPAISWISRSNPLRRPSFQFMSSLGGSEVAEVSLSTFQRSMSKEANIFLQIVGSVDRVVFRAPGGYTVARLRVPRDVPAQKSFGEALEEPPAR